MSDRSKKSTFFQNDWRFVAWIIVLLGMTGCGGPSQESKVSSSGESIPLTPSDLEYHSGTPADFPQSQGRFSLPYDWEARWPIDEAEKNISSTFGPRLKASEASRPDFHRGIDIPGDLGQPVYPILAGKIYKVVAGGESSEGGNVVTIEHTLSSPIVFHGKVTTRIFSQYAHLSSFGDKAEQWLQNPNLPIEISPEETVGALGQSGTTTFNHVHFEIRVETTCSLEYQVDHPETQCAQNGFDPHVNPLQFLLKDDGASPNLSGLAREGDSLVVKISTGPLWADFDYLVLSLIDEEGEEIRQYRLGFNAREGFDATSTESLDSAQLDGGVVVAPEPFLSDSQAYSIEFSFDLASLSQTPAGARLLGEDVWGNGFSTQFSLGL